MFRKSVSQTQMTSDTANDFFRHISGDLWNGDVTFVSTLRALVAPRMQEGERLYVKFRSTSYSARWVANTPSKQAVSAIFNPNSDYNGTIIIHNFKGRTQEDNFANLELMKSTFCQVYPEWHCLEKVTDFFRKTFYVLCFVNPKSKSVVVFADNMDIRKMHYLQCSIFAFLPWYFDPKAGVSLDEIELIQSLQEKTSTKYEEYIEKIADKYDFRTARIRQLLSGFETKFEKLEWDRVRHKITEIDTSIKDYSNAISRRLVERKNEEVRLLGLESKIAQSDKESEIMEYFLANDKLVLENVTNSTMEFCVKGYLTYFDEDMAKSIIDNTESYIYYPNGVSCNDYILAEDVKRLMYAIFIYQTIRIKFCAAYRFSLEYQCVDGLSGYRYGAGFREYMPNTHIDAYHCMGNYENVINQLLSNNNYIGAIEQCIASCQSLNFADSTVMREFIKRLYGIRSDVNNRCIELSDGRVVTAKEAAEWLKEQEAGTDE